jgi:hypothetical protein
MFGNGKIIHMQQIEGFDDITVLPAVRYLERSLLLGDTVCVTNETDLSILPWLQEVELAPERVIQVEDKCMFAGIRKDPRLFNELRSQFSQGARPMFFHPTKLVADFIKEAGLAWEQTASCDPEVADFIGRKDCLRQVAERAGLAGNFPPYVILPANWNMAELNEAIAVVRRRAYEINLSQVMVKRTDLVSGEGMQRIGGQEFRRFAERQLGHALIVEVEIQPHTPISNQWCITKGDPIYVGASKQLQEGFVHKGNIIASDDRMLPDMINGKLRRMTEPLVRYAVEMGYNGIIGFDAVWNEEANTLFLTESNARVTAATYPFGVAKRLGYKEWAIAAKTIVPAGWIETFNGVRGRLGNSLLFNPRRHCGVIPYMTGALTHPTMRRMGIMAVANDPRHAEQTLAEAEKRLTS